MVMSLSVPVVAKHFVGLLRTAWRAWELCRILSIGVAHRLRRRYRELLRAEIAHTVATPDEIEQEVRDLIAAVSG
jgi:hypothetical protein